MTQMSFTSMQRDVLTQPNCENLSLSLEGNCSLGKTPGNHRIIKTKDNEKAP